MWVRRAGYRADDARSGRQIDFRSLSAPLDPNATPAIVCGHQRERPVSRVREFGYKGPVRWGPSRHEGEGAD